jgi:RNA polymerase sigma-70 factor, ECF subfamily
MPSQVSTPRNISTTRDLIEMSMESPKEEDVLERVSTLAQAERSQLAALARSEGVSPEDAVDCVQEGLCTLLTLHRRSALPEDPGEWGPVLAGIVRNVARNRRRRHFVSQPHRRFEDLAIVSDAQPSDEVLARAETHVRLHACVRELCEIQRAVVTLRMLEEKSGDDVATALGISAGHVAVLLHRAKHMLRSCMAEPAQG